MKLINKTQRIYLILIVILLLVGSGLFMFAISSVLKKNVDQALQSDLQRLIEQSKTRDSIPVISTPQIKITPLANLQNTAINFSDTALFKSVEQEPFTYRQVTTQAKIGGQPYQFVLRRAEVESDDLFEAILIVELIFTVLLVIGLFLINKSVIQRIWSPFYHTLQQVSDYKIDRKKPLKWSETEIYEFQQLNDVLKQMTRQVERDYKSLKQFTENASHEIQTPLSVINSRIEIMLQEGDFSDSQWKSVGEIYRASSRLSRLNRALLLLTKIENRQFTKHKPVDIKILLDELLCNYEELITQKNLTLEINIDDEIIINANPELIELLLRNVLSNAVKHNVNDGVLKVCLSKNRLCAANTGPTPKEDVSRYFERFHKQNGGSTSLGLGLAIIKEICEVNDFECDYLFEDGLHIMKILF